MKFHRRSAGRAALCGRALVAAGVALGLAVALAAPAAAQRFPVRTFSERDGLRSSTVHDVAQDPEGRMWFLTRAGAVRYDGFDWEAPGRRPSHRYFGYSLLAVDPAEGVWIAGEEAHLPLVSVGTSAAPAPEIATPAAGPAEAERRTAFAVFSNGAGTVFALGTRGAGLHLRRGGRWETLGPEDGLPQPSVRALEVVGQRLFVGTGGGLVVLADGRIDPSPNRLLPPERRDLRALAWDYREETLWLVGPDWVGRIVDGRFGLAADDLTIPPDPDRPQRMAEADGRGGLFFGSATRLLHLDGESGEVIVLGRRNGLASEGATGLALDRELNLWVATPRGVSQIPSLRFAHWDASQGLLEDEVSAAVEWAPGELVFGHNGGLSVFRDGEVVETISLERRELDDAPLGRVMDLAVGPDGTLWAAVGHRGLARISPSRELRWLGGGTALGDRVDTIVAQPAGRVIVGTGEGLAEVAGGRLVPIASPGIGKPRVRRLVASPGGTLYAATSGDGLFYRPAGGAWRGARGELASENDLFTVLEDGAGQVWVGSAAGLLVLEDGGLERPEPRSLRIDRPVYALVEDPEGRLWIGTDSGFARWNGVRLESYGARDGIAGNEANRAASMVDRAGRLWLGTDGGVTLVRDRSDLRVLPPPPVRVLEVAVDDRAFPPDRPLDLGHQQNRIAFRFGAVSFRGESGITYRTMLEGYDRVWVTETGPARFESRYSALPPGHYRFRVQARSDRSAWSEVASTAPVVIGKPFWRQAWFLAAVGLVLVGFGYSGHRFQAQRRYARTLEREVSLRTAELVKAQKLEWLGIVAGGIAHDFNNLLTVILGYLGLVQTSPRLSGEDLDHLDQVQRALGRAQELSRRLLTFSRGGAPVTGPVSVARLVRECSDFHFRGTQVRCRVELPDGLWAVEGDEGQISQVINNLALNALQSMPAGGEVTVSADNLELAAGEEDGLPAGRYVRLRVTDRGVGIAPEDLDRIFDPFFTTKDRGSGLGLTTVHSIVRQHGGSVRVASTPGEGSRFEVVVPASLAQPAAVAAPAPVAAAGTGHVLVMDDQEAVRRVLESMLTHLGYRAEGTADGDEAVTAYRRAVERGEPFDLVILDLMVPGGKGGREALQDLRRLDPEVVAVASSGYADDPVLSTHGGDGFAAALPKPYTLPRLEEVLGRVRRAKVRQPRVAAARSV